MTSERNPSPPHEASAFDATPPDAIGSTAFSKQGVYRAMITLLKEVSEEENASSGDDPSAYMPSEVDGDVEEQLCALWDMSVNAEVAQFLPTTPNFFSLITTAITTTNKPRLTEILCGIVANMASHENVLGIVSTEDQLLRAILQLSSCTDAATLTQVLRLVTAATSTEHIADNVKSALRESQFTNNLNTVLNNCRNTEALLEAASCACALLDSEAFDELFECDDDSSCLLSALESAHEELCEAGSDLSSFVRAAYLHSTNERAATHFAKHGMMFYQRLIKREPTTDNEKQMFDLICSAFSECFS